MGKYSAKARRLRKLKKAIRTDGPVPVEPDAIVPNNHRRIFVSIGVVIAIASIVIATASGKASLLWGPSPAGYYPQGYYNQTSYPGDTERVVETWQSNRSGDDIEALEEAEAIALDPKASKEERCTAEAEVAYSAWQLGKTDVAQDAISKFEKQIPGLNINPKVLDQAQGVKRVLAYHVDAKDLNPISGWDWTHTKKTLQNGSFTGGLAGWWFDTRGGKYTAGTDPNGFGPGKASAYITSSVAGDKEWNWLAQAVAGDHYLGKRVEITAWLKTEGVTGNAILRVRIDSPSVNFVAHAPDRFLIGTTQWQEQTIVLDVPQDAQGIALGVALAGSGKASLADVNLQVVRTGVPTTPERSEF